jgi:glycosyltransferase involved in cell wall biosynthesis
VKIGVVVPGFSANERDWCIPALLNFVRVSASAHSVYVFALHYPFRRAQYSVYGATIHGSGGRNRVGVERARMWARTLAAMRAEHARGRFDLLHAFWANESGFLATIAGRALRVPVVVSLAGGEVVAMRDIGYGSQVRAFERMLVRATLRRATRVTVGSRYMQSLAWSRGARAEYAPLGVDTQMFAPGTPLSSPLGKSGPGRGPRTLNVGSLVPVKQQQLLLDAFARLKDTRACLTLVGAGAWEQRLREHARDLGISARVEWRGAVQHAELASTYPRADVFVQTARHEAQGMAVLEAAASGVAIVGTRVGVVPELARAGAAIDADGEADALADAIVRAVEERAAVGANRREFIVRQFSLDAARARWEKIYGEVAAR